MSIEFFYYKSPVIKDIHLLLSLKYPSVRSKTFLLMQNSGTLKRFVLVAGPNERMFIYSNKERGAHTHTHTRTLSTNQLYKNVSIYICREKRKR